MMKHIGRKDILIGTAALLLAACGGAGNTAAPVPAHTAMPGEPALIQVAGYQYGNLSEQDVKDVGVDPKALMTEANAETPGLVTGASAHWIYKTSVHDKNMVIVEMQIAPKYAHDPELQKHIVPGMVAGLAGSGATVSQKTMSTETVAAATYEQGGDTVTAYAWFHNDVITMVLGHNAPQATTDFVTSYLATAHK